MRRLIVVGPVNEISSAERPGRRLLGRPLRDAIAAGPRRVRLGRALRWAPPGAAALAALGDGSTDQRRRAIQLRREMSDKIATIALYGGSWPARCYFRSGSSGSRNPQRPRRRLGGKPCAGRRLDRARQFRARLPVRPRTTILAGAPKHHRPPAQSRRMR